MECSSGKMSLEKRFLLLEGISSPLKFETAGFVISEQGFTVIRNFFYILELFCRGHF